MVAASKNGTVGDFAAEKTDFFDEERINALSAPGRSKLISFREERSYSSSEA
jgi:hypothetical protein